MSELRLTGTFRCAPGEVEIVRAALPEHIRLSRAEPGCLQFDIEPTDDPCAWRLTERFADRAAFEAHQARTRGSAWWRATAHMERDFTIED